MYDAIVQDSPSLPPGVTLTGILSDCLRDGGEILQTVLEKLPKEGTVTAEQQIPAGKAQSGFWRNDASCAKCSHSRSSLQGCFLAGLRSLIPLQPALL